MAYDNDGISKLKVFMLMVITYIGNSYFHVRKSTMFHISLAQFEIAYSDRYYYNIHTYIIICLIGDNMKLSTSNPNNADDIEQLFIKTFSDSEGQSEGELIGGLVVYSSSEFFSEVQDAEATSDYYYLLGRTKDEAQISLYRFSAETHDAFQLIDGAEYELYAFTVTGDNLVAFKAVRRSDGASIGGTINLSGDITIIEAIQDRDIVQLVRVL